MKKTELFSDDLCYSMFVFIFAVSNKHAGMMATEHQNESVTGAKIV